MITSLQVSSWLSFWPSRPGFHRGGLDTVSVRAEVLSSNHSPDEEIANSSARAPRYNYESGTGNVHASARHLSERAIGKV